MADQSKTEAQLKSEAQGAATTRLKQAHRAEYNTFVEQEMAKRGVQWNPRPTAEEKAKAKLDAILEEYPHLATKVV